LESGQSQMVDHLQKRLDIVRSNSPVVELPYTRPDDTNDVSELKHSLEILEDRYNSSQVQLHTVKETSKKLEGQIRDLKNENLLLKQRHQYELEKIANIGMEKVKLGQNLEITEERQFNLSLEPPIQARSRSFSSPIMLSNPSNNSTPPPPPSSSSSPSASNYNLKRSPSNNASSSFSALNPGSSSSSLNGTNTSTSPPPVMSGSSHSSPNTSPIDAQPNASHLRTKKPSRSGDEVQGH